MMGGLPLRSLRNPDVIAGLVFIALGAVFASQAAGLRLGTTLRMGPGYLPLLLSAILGLLGVLTLIGGLRTSAPETIPPINLKGLALVTGSALFFALALPRLGLPVATFGTIVIAASAGARLRPLETLLTAAVFTVVAWFVFAKALGLPFRLLGTWFGG